MDADKTVLILLIAVFTVSGCVGGGGNSNSGPSGAVSVQSLSVQPSEIFAGGNVRVNMGIANTGQLPATLQVGEDGSSILTSGCQDIFDIQSFEAESSNISDTRESYKLAPQYEVSLGWNLEQSTGNVPLNGYRCNMRFEVPFDYSVESFRQIQIKESERVENAELFAQSSQGPLDIQIQAIGSSAASGAPVFLKDDGGEILIQLVNRQTEDSRYQGLIELEPPALEARGIEFDEVDITSDNEEIAKDLAEDIPDLDPGDVNAGDSVRMCPDPTDLIGSPELSLNNGASETLRCDIQWELNGPSMRGEVFAQTDYTFVKKAGSQRVDVRYRGE